MEERPGLCAGGRRLWQAALLSTLVSVPCGSAWALRCVPPAPLLPLPPGQNVVLAEILARRDDGSLEIRVLEVLQGSLPGRSAPSPEGLRLDARSLSYWSFGRLPFPRGSRWIFQLTGTDPRDRQFDAAVSPCIEPPRVVKDVVRGWLRGTPRQEPHQSMTLQELRRRIRTGSRSPGAPPAAIGH